MMKSNQSEYQLYLQQQFLDQDKSKKSVSEEIFKTIKEKWNEKLGYVPQKPMALITIHDPDDSNIIKSMGASEPDDIITDQFGAIFAGQYNNGGAHNRIIPDRDGFSRIVRVGDLAGSGYAAMVFGGQSVGMQFWVGRNGNSDPVTRSDFTLNDEFVVAPQTLPFNMTAAGGWIPANEHVVAEAVLNGVVGNDSIGECGLLAKWTRDPFNVTSLFLITHDIAGGAFVDGQNINVTYTWSIS